MAAGMHDASVSLLNAWDSFYVIVGSSAAALTGLMFVVVSLIRDAREQVPPSESALAAYASPTVVHFCAVLLVSAVLSAPWPSLSDAAALLVAIGAMGIAYTVMVIRRMRAQRDYQPVFEDWLCHAILPVGAYILLDAAGWWLFTSPAAALFATALATLVLLFDAIHNAWDTVMYVALRRAKAEDDDEPEV
jgi:hypothetical protein